MFDEKSTLRDYQDEHCVNLLAHGAQFHNARKRSVAIVGSGLSLRNYHGGADEVWTCNSLNLIDGKFENRALCFWMDDFDILFHDEGNKYKHYWPVVAEKQNTNGQVITCRWDERWPWVKTLPLHRMFSTVNCDWINNSIPYMILTAMYMDVRELHLHGTDFGSPANDRDHEAQCTTYWIALAIAQGIDVRINSMSSMLEKNYPIYHDGKPQSLYGFKYLDYERKWLP